MEILTYNQIENKEGLVPLFYRGFGYAFDHWRFDERLKKDPNFKDCPAAFVARVEGVLAGLVGVMDFPTRTLKGEELAGGVWAVLTLPTHSRQGIATLLLEKAHSYFREKGMRMAFLSTMRSWYAYDLYKKLGYRDVQWYASRPLAYKMIPPDKRGENTTLKQVTAERMAELFRQFTRDKTGFVIRPPSFLEMRTEYGPLKAEFCMETEGGYALAGGYHNAVSIFELAALNDEAHHTLLADFEGRSASIVDRMVATDALLNVYRERGYTFNYGAYGVYMAKPLVRGASVERVYGDAFYVSALERL
jgi:GNAT superfamily N-acetyltransferase